jgi:hypothetical protein
MEGVRGSIPLPPTSLTAGKTLKHGRKTQRRVSLSISQVCPVSQLVTRVSQRETRWRAFGSAKASGKSKSDAREAEPFQGPFTFSKTPRPGPDTWRREPIGASYLRIQRA